MRKAFVAVCMACACLMVAGCGQKWKIEIPEDNCPIDMELVEKAKSGDEMAAVELARLYMRGEGGVTVNGTLGEALLESMIESGSAYAKYTLGECYQKGWGVMADPHRGALMEREAYEQLKPEAEKGDADAQCYVGLVYEYGVAFDKDMKEAAAWYAKAAEQGQARAQAALGTCYAKGEGVKQSNEEAAAWYAKAANQGYVRAQYNLGMCYLNGQGVKADEAEGAKWLAAAAAQGNASAEYSLAECYMRGVGVKQSPTEAVKYFTSAAKHGSAEAEVMLRKIRERVKDLGM